jgi:hypothetical protein
VKQIRYGYRRIDKMEPHEHLDAVTAGMAAEAHRERFNAVRAAADRADEIHGTTSEIVEPGPDGCLAPECRGGGNGFGAE